ncbi:MAG: hypothetical protein B6D55_08735 [Candidatus Omnitrophica bacterium 4484_70.2]|nr:MAG: hypothetical protein B6D55_08735 [Candidatus Omnitrophica bacterium 4484_70.2]
MKLIDVLKKQELNFHIIDVENLTLEQTLSFISELLSEEPAKIESLSSIIHSQTGGNPFFIIETVHSLITQGVITFKDGETILDTSKLESFRFSEDIIDILLLRINTLSSDTLTVLSYASVIGKKFLLQEIFNLLSFMQPSKIIECIEEAIRERLLSRNVAFQEEIVFVHDRVRDAFYKKLDIDTQKQLHRKIAFFLEEQYKRGNSELIHELAIHFLEAGIEDKGLVYSLEAAKRSKLDYAFEEAVTLFSRSKEILEKYKKQNTPQYLNILENLGELYFLTGKFDTSLETFRSCLSLIPSQDLLHIVKIYGYMGDVLLGKGNLNEAIEVLHKGLKILKVPEIPSNKFHMKLVILKELFRELLHINFPQVFISRRDKSTPLDISKLELFEKICKVYYFVDKKKMFYYYLKGRNLSEKLGILKQMGHYYLYGGAVWITFPNFRYAFKDLENAINIAQRLGDRNLNVLARSYYYIYVAYFANQPTLAVQYGEEIGKDLFSIGEFWTLSMVGQAFLVHNYLLVGEFKKALKLAEESLQLARSLKTLQTTAVSLNNMTSASYYIGNVDERILELAKEAIDTQIKAGHRPGIVYSKHHLAFIYLRRREFEKAIEVIEETIKLFPTYYEGGVWNVIIFPTAAEIYIEFILDRNPQDAFYIKRILLDTASICRLSIFDRKN